jgi:hypothetical protein
MKTFLENDVKKIKTQILRPVTFFPESHAHYDIMWKNIVELSRPLMTIWRMLIACWPSKSTNAQTGFVILIAFPLQQWLLERSSMLRRTYIACLVHSE